MAIGDSTYNSQVPAAARPPAPTRPTQGPTLPGQATAGGPVPKPLPAFGTPVNRPPSVTRPLQSRLPTSVYGTAHTFAGVQAYQLGPGVGYMPNFYPQSEQGHNYANEGYMGLSAADKARLNGAMDAIHGKGVWKQNWIKNTWAEGVQAADYWAQQGVYLSPLDALERSVEDGLAGNGSGSGGGGGGGGGGGVSSQRTVQYNITDPQSAERLVNAMLSAYMGRQAKPKEQEAFLKALNRHERQNPDIAQSTTVVGGGTANTVSTQSGGTSREQFAEDWALAQEGSAEYQAQTKYLSTFMSALENPLDVV